jgi:hypothetical protein
VTFYPQIPTNSLIFKLFLLGERSVGLKCSRKKNSSPFRSCGWFQHFYNRTEVHTIRTKVPRCFWICSYTLIDLLSVLSSIDLPSDTISTALQLPHNQPRIRILLPKLPSQPHPDMCWPSSRNVYKCHIYLWWHVTQAKSLITTSTQDLLSQFTHSRVIFQITLGDTILETPL